MEPILDPELPIIDSHHHLWDRRSLPDAAGTAHVALAAIAPKNRYLLDDYLSDTGSGHNVIATVFAECAAFYRADGPEALRSLGETEFATGVAAMSASGVYGATRVCAAIIGRVDLTLGDAVGDILDRHCRIAESRFKGVRHGATFDADPNVMGPLNRVEHLYATAEFRAGFRHLAKRGLSFDAWVLAPQLPDVIDLARAFPDTRIVLDHAGTPPGLGRYEGSHAERFAIWRANMAELAHCPNVAVKLGGLGMGFCNFPSFGAVPRATSSRLAEEWRPYIETCIEAFGVNRAMFESNFPVDIGAGDYVTIWNAFKRIAAGASPGEKAALFAGTASAIYRLIF
jgi:L-fuconolactonase